MVGTVGQQQDAIHQSTNPNPPLTRGIFLTKKYSFFSFCGLFSFTIFGFFVIIRLLM